jgi:vacuolar-type H+-ATPase subunit E/Vma4
MSLNAILETIRTSGEVRIHEIEKQAQIKAREILASARLEAQQEEEKARAAAILPASHERARIIHRARLEALRITGDVRESLVDAALDQARGRLAGIRTDQAYPAVFRQLIGESLKEIEGPLGDREDSQGGQRSGKAQGKAQLEINSQDQEILGIILEDLCLDLPRICGLDSWGGLIAKSEDGRVVVINTLEARLERATPYLRHYLAAIFEDEQPEMEEGELQRKATVY